MTPRARLPDADARLEALLRSRERTPLRWGVSDCAMLGADAVLAVTGWDPAAGLRGTYGSRGRAFRLLRAHGGLAALLDARLGPRQAPAAAADGDVVQLGADQLGVWWRGIVVAQGGQHLVWRPAGDTRAIWKAAA